MKIRGWRFNSFPIWILQILTLVFAGIKAYAVDQQWLSLQADHQLSNQHQLSLNFHRRDRADLYSKRLLNLYRLHYRIPVDSWQITFGGAYFDSQSGNSERRLHQYADRNIKLLDDDILASSIRLGVEERHFNSDNNLYLRFRLRVQFHILPKKAFGPSLYHESFYIPNGQDRFVSALSENRTGIGLHYTLPYARLLLFHTYTLTKLPEKMKYEQWLQLFINFPF